MKRFNWSHSKNERLKFERQISFEEIVLAIEDGGLLDVLKHVNARSIPTSGSWSWPCRGTSTWCRSSKIENREFYFLKTVLPSRKATRDYLHHGDPDAQA